MGKYSLNALVESTSFFLIQKLKVAYACFQTASDLQVLKDAVAGQT